jgi:membrane protein DedA with SNARE-associated domain
MNKNSQFVIRSLFRGIVWLAAFLLLYFVGKHYIDLDFLAWLEPIFEQEYLIMSVFLISEVVIGIIPPEIFMIWALRFEVIHHFLLIVAALSIISYLAGVVGFLIGRYLSNTIFYRYIRRRFLSKTEKRLQTFGLYLIIVASLTPIPFSGVAMLVGSVRYSLKKYLYFSLFRFLRFGIYAWVFWEARAIL